MEDREIRELEELMKSGKVVKVGEGEGVPKTQVDSPSPPHIRGMVWLLNRVESPTLGIGRKIATAWAESWIYFFPIDLVRIEILKGGSEIVYPTSPSPIAWVTVSGLTHSIQIPTQEALDDFLARYEVAYREAVEMDKAEGRRE